MSRRSIVGFGYFILALAAAVSGCSHKPPPATTSRPVVAVSKVIERPVKDFEDFTGRTDAVESVDVKARVSGYLVEVGFRSGSDVRGDEKTTIRVTSTVGIAGSPLSRGPLLAVAALCPGRGLGDLLFVIDPRPYQADYDRAISQVALAEARLKLAIADLGRAREIAKTPGAISQQEVDKYAASRDEAAAQVSSAQANVESARLNLEFTRITSPIDGRTSRNYLTVGNLVTKDETLLTTVVSEDPIYAYFDVDERTMLRVQRLMREGKLKSAREHEIPVHLGLANEEGHLHQGVIDFVNNKVDPFTGTLTVRGVFPNPKPPQGPRMLGPGEFVRIRLPIGQPYSSLLVAERAIATDQGQKYLYIVDDKNIVQSRRIKLGPLQPDGLRVIQEGLQPGEWVVVSGLQQVRARMEVQTEPVPMPATPKPGEPGPSGTGAKDTKK